MKNKTIPGLITMMAIVLVVIFSGCFESKTDIYFDNGFENSFDIFINGTNKGSIPPKSMEKISIKKGEHRIEIRKNDGELFESKNLILSESKYIYNIGRKYFYYIEIREYGGIKWDEWDTQDIGSETLIKYPAVDYDFNEKCPDVLVVPAGQISATRTKLNKRIA